MTMKITKYGIVSFARSAFFFFFKMNYSSLYYLIKTLFGIDYVLDHRTFVFST